jgi:NAD(P)H-hydrate epimerase
MAAVDAEATEPVDVLIGRAGAAVARVALGMLGGSYGRSVVVLCGPGNNGADGRIAGQRLARRGVRVTVVPVGEAPERLPEADLVIDAAFGTGLSRPYDAPSVCERSLVLAVDIPSGVSGLTGELLGSPMPADATVTFAALKPGLLLGRGPELAGVVEVADIGLEVGRASQFLFEYSDLGRLATRIPAHGGFARPSDDHKWRRAVWMIAGSAQMRGAAQMAAAAALRSGAGYVRVSSPGADEGSWDWPIEAVHFPLPRHGWSEMVLADAHRFGALVVGPGLGRDEALAGEIGALAECPVPVILDGDALTQVGEAGGQLGKAGGQLGEAGGQLGEAGGQLGEAGTVAGRLGQGPRVLTPHDGEFRALTGHYPGPDRVEAARRLAAANGAVVLLKGPTTLIADPSGTVFFSTAGDQRLATAGSGDVLAGILSALVASGLDAATAAAAAAEIHGAAARSCENLGMVATDVVHAIPAAIRRASEGGR